MSDITPDSKIKEVMQTPIGHDIFSKLLTQSGVRSVFVKNPIVENMKLKSVMKLTKKFLNDDFWNAFFGLVNGEKGIPAPLDTPITHKWWKEAVIYQIYPRTFADSNDDGVGDLNGIISKLDYLKDLGVDALWLSPIYDSPMVDNGYDIRDYKKINPDFGTMKEFDTLLAETHKRGMRLIMDLVVNHTSDEHEWFQKAISDNPGKYRDYYFIREGNGDTPPNNWDSFFSGSAWSKYGKNNDWALHLFAKKQVDLNWDNPDVRKDVAAMINWWLDKGVDGFRMDVINFISKEEGLPDGSDFLSNLVGHRGIEHYYYGPHLHEYLHELNVSAFEPHDAFTVGETPGVGMQAARFLTGEERKELDLIFSFDHLESSGHVRWDDYKYDLNYLRDYMIDWQTGYGNNCWMSLFYNNHDNPRMASKIDPTGIYATRIQELLAVMQFTLRGTPFVYQGDEMGLKNYDFKSIDDLNDIESINYYHELLANGKTEEEAWCTILAGSRDHARVLLPWNEEAELSFTGQGVNEYIRSVYKELIKLRKENEALVYGDFKVLNKSKNRFVYERSNEDSSFIIDCNLSEKETKPYEVCESYELVWPKALKGTKLSSYGVRIWKKQK